jgi:hypothetical protein
MRTALTLLVLLLAALAVEAQTVSAPVAPRIRLIQPHVVADAPAPTTTQAMSASANTGCPDYQIAYAGACWDKSPQFGTYFQMAAYCGDNGGRLPGLGELAGFTARFNVSGIECSSDFDTGSGTLWCADASGASGKTLSQAVKSLYEIKAEFRCVHPRSN